MGKGFGGEGVGGGGVGVGALHADSHFASEGYVPAEPWTETHLKSGKLHVYVALDEPWKQFLSAGHAAVTFASAKLLPAKQQVSKPCAGKSWLHPPEFCRAKMPSPAHSFGSIESNWLLSMSNTAVEFATAGIAPSNKLYRKKRIWRFGRSDIGAIVPANEFLARPSVVNWRSLLTLAGRVP